MITTEKNIENALKKRVDEKKGFCIKLSPLSLVGIPDRLVILPGKKMAFVELKAPGKKPRDIQLVRHEQLRALGFQVFVIDDKAQIKGVLDEIA